jgi:hypothetical protein
VESVLRPSVNDGSRRLEHEKFDPLVVRFEKYPDIMDVIQVDFYLYTDSSSMGWSAHLLHHTASMKEFHINMLK